MRKIFVIAALAAMPLAARGQEPTFPTPSVGASSAALAQVFSDYWNWRLQESPEFATQLGRHEFGDRWRDWSKGARDRAEAQRRDFLQQVLYLNASGNLTDSVRLSANLLEYELRAALDTQAYNNVVQRISPQSGVHTQVFSVVAAMPARTVTDYENIVARLRAVPRYVDQHLALFREQIAAGVTQPEVVVDLVLDQLAAQRRPSALESPLLQAFSRFPAAIPGPEQERLRAAAVVAYDQQFVPSWSRLEAFMRETYRPKARDAIAVTTVPGGQRLYEVAVKFHTTTAMTADEIHALGLSEVERIDGAIAQIARADGFTGPVSEYEPRVAARMRYTSQQEMLDTARDVLRRLEPGLPKLFLRLPKMRVEVRPIPADREASTASNYEAGTTDGSRPAYFNMNTYRPENQSRHVTESLVIHETVPGHHLQIATARELEGVPDFRRAFGTTAFSEGWALYAESLGGELGVYREPAMRLGQLASEKFRAVRLVVDTGMHVKGWSRDRAREYFRQQVPGQSIAEIDRYIAWPGQALAYKIGQLRIRELRARAEKALGARFDIRDFHDVVLRNGALPLDLLTREVERYIASGRP